jgi:hypothetical protein
MLFCVVSTQQTRAASRQKIVSLARLRFDVIALSGKSEPASALLARAHSHVSDGWSHSKSSGDGVNVLP